MALLLANNVGTTLSGSALSTDLTLSLTSAAGFPTVASPDWAWATIVDATEDLWEVVKITGTSGTTLTVLRGQDGTTALGWASGSLVQLRANAQLLRDLRGVTYSYYDPVQPPASPSAMDDEFTGTSLSGIWTTVQGTYMTMDFGATVPGQMTMTVPSTGDHRPSIMQALPAGDFTVFTKISVNNATAAFSGGGFYMSNTLTPGSGLGCYAGLLNNGSMAFESVGDSAAFGPGLSNPFNVGGYGPSYGFLRLRRSGASYYAATSKDGISWAEVSFSPTLTPTYIGLGSVNSGSGVTITSSFDFFRYVASATASIGGLANAVRG